MPNNYSGDATAWVTTVPIPADGESISERNCAPAWRRCADRSAYNHRVMPRVATFAQDLPHGFSIWEYGNSGGIESTIAAGIRLDIPGCVVGDKLIVSAFMNYQRLATSAADVEKAFTVWIDAIDDAVGTPGVQTHVPGASWVASDGIDSDDDGRPLTLSLGGIWTVAEAGTTRLAIAFSGPTFGNGDGDEFHLYPSVNITAMRFPAT